MNSIFLKTISSSIFTIIFCLQAFAGSPSDKLPSNFEHLFFNIPEKRYILDPQNDICPKLETIVKYFHFSADQYRNLIRLAVLEEALSIKENDKTPPPSSTQGKIAKATKKLQKAFINGLIANEAIPPGKKIEKVINTMVDQTINEPCFLKGSFLSEDEVGDPNLGTNDYRIEPIEFKKIERPHSRPQASINVIDQLNPSNNDEESLESFFGNSNNVEPINQLQGPLIKSPVNNILDQDSLVFDFPIQSQQAQ